MTQTTTATGQEKECAEEVATRAMIAVPFLLANPATKKLGEGLQRACEAYDAATESRPPAQEPRLIDSAFVHCPACNAHVEFKFSNGAQPTLQTDTCPPRRRDDAGIGGEATSLPSVGPCQDAELIAEIDKRHLASDADPSRSPGDTYNQRHRDRATLLRILKAR